MHHHSQYSSVDSNALLDLIIIKYCVHEAVVFYEKLTNVQKIAWLDDDLKWYIQYSGQEITAAP